jgi:uncharacterized membrane protein
MAFEIGSLLNYGGALINAIVLIVSIAVLGVFGFFIVRFYTKWKMYSEYDVRILEKNAYDQWGESKDSAGVFTDPKTNNKRFFLKKSNVGLDPDNIPYITTPSSFGVKKIVYLARTGLKNFRFVTPTVQVNSPVSLNLIVGEEDVNWAVNAYERQKKLFANSMLMQLLPFIALAFVSIIILIIFIYFFRNFDKLVSMSLHFKEAIIAGSSGTAIIP